MNKRAIDEAVMLLSGVFPKDDSQPLTLSEYNLLIKHLAAENFNPGSLLEESLEKVLATWKNEKIPQSRIEALLRRGALMSLYLEKWERSGISIIPRTAEAYPARLRKLLGSSSPLLLFIIGRQSIFLTKGAAVVGSRDITDSEKNFAAALGEKIASQAYTVVSGAARGADEAAMMGAILAEGTAIGFVSNSLLRYSLYPEYRQAIQQQNLVLCSAVHPEAPFSVGNAMSRNKLIYAQSEISFVIRSDTKGGTWNGALENLRHQWTPLYVKKTEKPKDGNHQLVEKGGIWLPDEFRFAVEELIIAAKKFPKEKDNQLAIF
jgi:predicted Rossmann fold nucleotide-binding protein DprA/Smf involved in DNA uptake